MKRILSHMLVATAVLMVSALPASAVTVYSTFGPGDTYDSTAGVVVSGDSNIAASFTVPSANSYTLDSIRIGAGFYGTGGPSDDLIVRLTNNGGSTVYESLSVHVTNLNIYTVPSVSHPILTAGETYWVILSPENSSEWFDWQYNTQGIKGFYRTPPVTWVNDLNETPAFEVNGTLAPVPIPSALLLMGSGLAGLVGIGRRRMRK